MKAMPVKRGTLQGFLTGKYMPTLMEKPLMRRPRARWGALMYVCVRLFTMGAILGRARREQLSTIAAMLGEPDRAGSINEWIWKLGGDLMADYAQSPRSLVDLFLSSVLKDPWQETLVSTAQNTEPLDKAAILAEHAVLMGIAFGVRHPQLVPDMWRHDVDRESNPAWWTVLQTLKIHTEPEPASYEEKERTALQELAVFVNGEYPELLEPLSLTDHYVGYLEEADLGKDLAAVREGKELLTAYDEARSSPKDVYEEVLDEVVSRIASAVRDGWLTEQAGSVVEAITLGGCAAAVRVLGTVETLEKLWRDASDEKRTALAEVCTLQVMPYLMTSSEKVMRDYAEVVDELFDRSFPNAIDYSLSLFRQKARDDVENERRKETGEPGVSMWAMSLALTGAMSALGGTDSPVHPLPEHFPIDDSLLLKEAGVPLLYGTPGETFVYFSALVDCAIEAMKRLGEKRQLA